MPKLNDTQTLLLGHAARAEAGSFYPLPSSHADGGTRVSQALATLRKSGLAEEREATDVAQTYREEGDLRFGLYITPAGLATIGIEPDDTQSELGDPKPTAAAPAPARQTKAASVLALLQRPQGATLEDLIAATGWLPHTTRAALTGLRKKGHVIIKNKRDGATCYKVAAA